MTSIVLPHLFYHGYIYHGYIDHSHYVSHSISTMVTFTIACHIFNPHKFTCIFTFLYFNCCIYTCIFICIFHVVFLAVGAPKPHMQELSPDLVLRSRIYADSRSGVELESGDVIHAKVRFTSTHPRGQCWDWGKSPSHWG